MSSFEKVKQIVIDQLGVDEDKVVMEDAIRDHAGNTGRTRIVCRTGDPTDVGDLEIVSLNTAKSIVVLSARDDDPDARVIKTLLAITNSPGRRSEPSRVRSIGCRCSARNGNRSRFGIGRADVPQPIPSNVPRPDTIRTSHPG